MTSSIGNFLKYTQDVTWYCVVIYQDIAIFYTEDGKEDGMIHHHSVTQRPCIVVRVVL